MYEGKNREKLLVFPVSGTLFFTRKALLIAWTVVFCQHAYRIPGKVLKSPLQHKRGLKWRLCHYAAHGVVTISVAGKKRFCASFHHIQCYSYPWHRRNFFFFQFFFHFFFFSIFFFSFFLFFVGECLSCKAVIIIVSGGAGDGGRGIYCAGTRTSFK